MWHLINVKTCEPVEPPVRSTAIPPVPEPLRQSRGSFRQRFPSRRGRAHRDLSMVPVVTKLLVSVPRAGMLQRASILLDSRRDDIVGFLECRTGILQRRTSILDSKLNYISIIAEPLARELQRKANLHDGTRMYPNGIAYSLFLLHHLQQR